MICDVYKISSCLKIFGSQHEPNSCSGFPIMTKSKFETNPNRTEIRQFGGSAKIPIKLGFFGSAHPNRSVYLFFFFFKP